MEEEKKGVWECLLYTKYTAGMMYVTNYSFNEEISKKRRIQSERKKLSKLASPRRRLKRRLVALEIIEGLKKAFKSIK